MHAPQIITSDHPHLFSRFAFPKRFSRFHSGSLSSSLQLKGIVTSPKRKRGSPSLTLRAGQQFSFNEPLEDLTDFFHFFRQLGSKRAHYNGKPRRRSPCPPIRNAFSPFSWRPLRPPTPPPAPPCWPANAATMPSCANGSECCCKLMIDPAAFSINPPYSLSRPTRPPDNGSTAMLRLSSPNDPACASDATSCCSRSARAAWASSTWPSRNSRYAASSP